MTSLPPAGRADGRAATEKAALRVRLREARAQVSADDQAIADAARTDLLLGLVARWSGPPATVALYLSRPGEPDTIALAAALHRSGHTLLVPSPGLGTPWASPDWAPYGEPLSPGPRDIPVPPGPGLGAGALAEAGLIILPGLAGTPGGVRLGSGGGWYDRALLVAPEAERWLLVDDREVLEQLPHEGHDLGVDKLITQSRVVVCQPRAADPVHESAPFSRKWAPFTDRNGGLRRGEWGGGPW